MVTVEAKNRIGILDCLNHPWIKNETLDERLIPKIFNKQKTKKQKSFTEIGINSSYNINIINNNNNNKLVKYPTSVKQASRSSNKNSKGIIQSNNMINSNRSNKKSEERLILSPNITSNKDRNINISRSDASPISLMQTTNSESNFPVIGMHKKVRFISQPKEKATLVRKVDADFKENSMVEYNLYLMKMNNGKISNFMQPIGLGKEQKRKSERIKNLMIKYCDASPFNPNYNSIPTHSTNTNKSNELGYKHNLDFNNDGENNNIHNNYVSKIK